MSRLTRRIRGDIGCGDAAYGCNMCLTEFCWVLEQMLEKLAYYEDLEEQGMMIEQKHGQWELTARKGFYAYWGVFAECSECHNEETEIWGGYFPNIPNDIAKATALRSAENVKLSNYCPHCGAKLAELKGE